MEDKYKVEGWRSDSKPTPDQLVFVSGAFDPITLGRLKEAISDCSELVVHTLRSDLTFFGTEPVVPKNEDLFRQYHGEVMWVVPVAPETCLLVKTILEMQKSIRVDAIRANAVRRLLKDAVREGVKQAVSS